MADHSLIEWTDATWNPITGCSIVTPGCTNCYAMKLAGTRLKHHESRAGLTRDSKAGPVWTGEVRLNEQWLDQPLRWRTPRRIFVCAHGDLFAENVPDVWIDQVFAVMALAPLHTFQVLTKRASRMREYLTAPSIVRRIYELACDMVLDRRLHVVLLAPGIIPPAPSFVPSAPRVLLDRWPLPNVWPGVSVEDQPRADERIPDLLGTPAAVRFISAEPLIGPLDLTGIHHPIRGWPNAKVHALRGLIRGDGSWTRINWVIVGGESGQDARPMHPQWVRSLRDQCAAAGTAFFFKQWGAFRQLTAAERGQACGATFISGCDRYDQEAYVLPTSKKAAGRLLDGIEHNAMPKISLHDAPEVKSTTNL